MKQVLVLLFTATLASSQLTYKTDPLWLSFKNEFNKTNYSSPAEESLRYQIFLSNVDYINETNSGNSTSQLAINQFADLTFEEFKSLYLGFVPAPKDQLPKAAGTFAASSVGGSLPAYVDWRTKGAVTPVKYQGACGSCWAFSATGALEGQYAIRYGKQPPSLSEQNLMDCSWSYGNKGCNGGDPPSAFTYVRDNPGIDTESFYPYRGRNGQNCFFSKNRDALGAKCSGYILLSAGEINLQAAVAKIGPISVAVDATRNMKLWQPSDGVFYDSTCSSSYQTLNHAVLVVGYGTNSYDEDYWIVKNSWGSRWGDGGYIKMARNYFNMCGISTYASYPTKVTSGQPAVVSFNASSLILLITMLLVY